MKRKLLIATDCFLPRWDGIARFLKEIIPHLKEKYNITIVAPNYGSAPKLDGIKLVRFKPSKFKVGDYSPAWPSFRKLKDEIKKNDIIFVQTQGPIGVSAIFLGRWNHKPVISYVHSVEWDLFSKSLKRFKRLIRFSTKIAVRFIYNKCDMLMIPFLELKEIMRHHGIRRPEMVVVELGVDSNKFCPPENKEKAKELIGIEKSKTVIGFTGRMGREKDIPTLIKAFKELNKELPNTSLLIVGKGIDSIEKEIKGSKNIIVAGKKNDVVPYLQAMDIFVLPSLTETTSLATIEAMSVGIPVVATPVGYVKSYIKDRFNGLLFPQRNSLVLKLKLKQLVGDLIMRENLGRMARSTVKKKFDWDKTTKKLKFLLGQY